MKGHNRSVLSHVKGHDWRVLLHAKGNIGVPYIIQSHPTTCGGTPLECSTWCEGIQSVMKMWWDNTRWIFQIYVHKLLRNNLLWNMTVSKQSTKTLRNEIQINMVLQGNSTTWALVNNLNKVRNEAIRNLILTEQWTKAWVKAYGTVNKTRKYTRKWVTRC